ncbi:MAG: hypothetical protein G01um101418_820 [Parcubacteria group bacterium Gr01-1014_18]|nr:MAG: hypothetical protein Greene041636_800 [Parcubacteria group bacterium Greene0416_36]TSC80017.1 MAG: hypothetical protein G01um101418_820 [Parcubacteria group bacterium Gr01-1014_18]TSC98115.1 MAG: hypothetical protein Greene101420_886 [Parcubacteria group bacterium Greene1014_20]TSD06631.1 MAG: hypothetical protein Greene07142_770 [Parcubacteria group bacterium Greene0714_2]
MKIQIYLFSKILQISKSTNFVKPSPLTRDSGYDKKIGLKFKSRFVQKESIFFKDIIMKKIIFFAFLVLCLFLNSGCTIPIKLERDTKTDWKAAAAILNQFAEESREEAKKTKDLEEKKTLNDQAAGFEEKSKILEKAIENQEIPIPGKK